MWDFSPPCKTHRPQDDCSADRVKLMEATETRKTLRSTDCCGSSNACTSSLSALFIGHSVTASEGPSDAGLRHGQQQPAYCSASQAQCTAPAPPSRTHLCTLGTERQHAFRGGGCPSAVSFVPHICALSRIIPTPKAGRAAQDPVPFPSPPGNAALGHQLALLQRSQRQQIGAPIPLTFLENICFHYHYYF